MAFHMVRNRNAGQLKLLHIYNSTLKWAKEESSSHTFQRNIMLIHACRTTNGISKWL